jgi:hypothetical protein
VKRGLSALLLVALVSACGSQAAKTAGTTSPSASASTSGRYATAKDAGIAGVVAKTGSSYRADGLCPSGQSCLSGAQVFGNTDPNAGANAAYVQVSYGGSGGGAACFAYVFNDSSGWHVFPPVVCGQQGGLNPILGSTDQVQVAGGCGNVRQQPSLSSKVVACLKNGTTVTIDDIPPRYIEGHIWWSVNHQQGFMAHDVLVP